MAFLYPVLLWGMLAAAVPVLIHLLLRPRPRRLRFPAVRLMQNVLALGQRANRLRNILLLLSRAALLVCAALLLAGPTCTSAPAGGAATDAVAAVVVLDDSLSMQYRLRYGEPRTVLDEARADAMAYISASESWPRDTRLAVLRPSDLDRPTALTADRAQLRQRLAESTNEPHAHALGATLRTAVDLLRRESGPRQQQIIVFTDGAASAWHDVAPGIIGGADDLSVHVVCCALRARVNLAIHAVEPPPLGWPAESEAPLRVVLSSVGVDGVCHLAVRAGDTELTRSAPIEVRRDGLHDISLPLPPSPPGPHTALVTLEPDDLLQFDQTHHLTWQTAPRPTAWLITASTRDDDPGVTAAILRNLLAPQVLAPQQQRVALRVLDHDMIASGLAAIRSGAAKRPALVAVLAAGEADDAWPAGLVDLARQGATLLLVPRGPAANDWGPLRAVLSESEPIVEELDDAALRWIDAPAGQPDDVAALREIERARVRRRVRLLGLTTDAAVLARYADDVPALVARKIGRGRVVLLSTSPAPAWSDLGARAAGLLTWLHQLLDEAVATPSAVAQFTAGEALQKRFGVLPNAGLVHVQPVGGSEAAAGWLTLEQGQPTTPWPTPAAGFYAIRTRDDRDARAWYAVNWPTAESDLRPITHDALVRRLGTDNVVLQMPGGADAVARGGWSAWLRQFGGPRWPLGLVLLLIFVVELTYAARGER